MKHDGVAVGVIHPGWEQTDMGNSGAPISPVAGATWKVKATYRVDPGNAGSPWQWDGALHEW